MRKGYVLTSVISAVIGAGLMLLAVGGSKPAGIEGWTPINTEVASAMQKQVDMPGAATKPKEAATASAGKSQSSAARPEAERASESAGSAESSGQLPKQSLININQAGSAELQEIPGIGKKKAEAIIEYRKAHGAFTSVNDLKKVKGIGDKLLEKMKPYVGL